MHPTRQWNCWSFRCSCSIACRHCSNYIFIPDLVPDFNELGKDNCQTRQETFKVWDVVQLVLEIWQYIPQKTKNVTIVGNQVSQMWVPLAACREPAGSYNRLSYEL